MQVAFQKIQAIFLVALFPLFFWWGPGYESARSLQELWNLGHTVFFCLLTLSLFSHNALASFTSLQRAFCCLAVTIFVGGGIELVQLALPERIASFSDLQRDVSGSMIALFYITIKAAQTNFIRMAAFLCGLTVLAMAFFSLVQAIYNEVAARRAMPMLASFEHAWELQQWEVGRVRVARVASPVRDGSHSLQINFTTETYSGLSLVHFPRDWRGYRAICFSVYNPGEPVDFHFRVHDGLHREMPEYTNRFNRKVSLVEGWNDIRVDMDDILTAPQGRQMDLSNVQGIVFFVMEQKIGRILYLDAVRLE